MEFARLAQTFGIDVVNTLMQQRQAPSGSYIGEGKLQELARLVVDEDAAPIPNMQVIVDGELSPGQQRAMSLALGVPVLDRTAIILRIFEQRAQTPRAKLEVEIARIMYELPRLRDDDAIVDKQGGGGGRAERGHTSVELGKQQLRERLAKLRWSLSQLQQAAVAKRRGARKLDVARVALVGYTNAGKSSLMRALTGSEVLVEDKLFATLGVTTRPLSPKAQPNVLVTDTVGFIQRLPHDLVASFRSTLDEACDADRLLLVVDASDAAWRSQWRTTRETLASIGAHAPVHLVLNKIDRVPIAERLQMAQELPDALLVNAHDADDIQRLREAIVASIDRDMTEAVLEVPFSRGAFSAEIRSVARVLDEQHTESACLLRVRAPSAAIERWRTALL